jgi:Cd(II)/Pb(II)-responsive transcriptional regulator
MGTEMRIGQLAKLTGCQAETIRFYENKGLLPPPARLGNNYRLYGTAHADRLHLIRRCRSLGMSLDEIQTLLGFHDHPEQPCDGVNDLLDRHIGEIERKISELRTLHLELSSLRARCASPHSAADCRILQALSNHSDARSCLVIDPQNPE